MHHTAFLLNENMCIIIQIEYHFIWLSQCSFQYKYLISMNRWCKIVKAMTKILSSDVNSCLAAQRTYSLQSNVCIAWQLHIVFRTSISSNYHLLNHPSTMRNTVTCISEKYFYKQNFIKAIQFKETSIIMLYFPLKVE